MGAWKSGFRYFVSFSFTGQRESQVNGPDERQISHEPSRSPSRTKKSQGVARVAHLHTDTKPLQRVSGYGSLSLCSSGSRVRDRLVYKDG